MTVPSKNPTSAIAVSVAKDELGAIKQSRSPDESFLNAQKYVEIGLPVPVVFAKEISGVGGVWIYPYAIRYGSQLNAAFGTASSIAYIISEGEIGSITTSDIYKGQILLSSILGSAAVTAYGSIPTTGFNYTISAQTLANSDFYVATPITTTYTLTETNVTYVAIENLRVFTPPNLTQLFSYTLTADGVTIATSGAGTVSSLNYATTFTSLTTLVLTVSTATPYPAGTTLYSRFGLQQLVAESPETSTAYIGEPRTSGSGGTFIGLTCLAVKAAFTTGGSSFSDSTVDNYSSAISTQVTITKNDVTSLAITDMKVMTGGLTQFFAYDIYVDGVLADGTSAQASIAVSGLNYSKTYLEPVNVQIVITSYSGGVLGNPYPSGTTLTATITTGTLSVSSASSALPSDPIRCLVRNGIEVYNLLTTNTASSSNFLDLAYYLLQQAGVPNALINISDFTAAATFTAYHSLYFNGALTTATNLKTFFEETSPFFFLRSLTVDGKYSFKPLLPVNNDGSFDDDVITAVHTFDMDDITEGSYTRTYIPHAERKNICALMEWRNQSSTDVTGNMLEVRYSGEAADGPFESYDMYNFCVSEAHAALIGKYILASRKHITHTVTFATTVDVINLSPLDIIKIDWNYADALDTTGGESYFYQIDTISELPTGAVEIAATHFPINEAGKSTIIADILTASYTED
jgi:hypothetical protein